MYSLTLSISNLGKEKSFKFRPSQEENLRPSHAIKSKLKFLACDSRTPCYFMACEKKYFLRM